PAQRLRHCPSCLVSSRASLVEHTAARGWLQRGKRGEGAAGRRGTSPRPTGRGNRGEGAAGRRGTSPRPTGRGEATVGSRRRSGLVGAVIKLDRDALGAGAGGEGEAEDGGVPGPGVGGGAVKADGAGARGEAAEE